MRVYLGSDRAGFELKRRLMGHLTAQGHEPSGLAARLVYDPEDDYPPFVHRRRDRDRRRRRAASAS